MIGERRDCTYKGNVDRLINRLEGSRGFTLEEHVLDVRRCAIDK